MMRLNFRSVLDEFLSAARGAFTRITEAEANALAQHLQILQAAPEPDLAAGRERVIGEVVRLRGRQQDGNRWWKATQPRFSLSSAVVALLLVIGPLAVLGLALNSGHSGGSIFEFFSTPTLAYSSEPATRTSEAVVNLPTPISNPTPSRTGMKITALPIRMLEPTIIPEPTPGPMLTLTVPAQAQPAY